MLTTSTRSRLVATAAVLALAGPGLLITSAQAGTQAVPTDLAGYLAADRTDLQWSLRSGHLEQAWQVTTGAGVTVAVIDTGVDRTLPDLVGQTVGEAHVNFPGTAIVPGYVADPHGHGSHVAGIIAARRDGSGVTGIAPDAKIMPISLGMYGMSAQSIANAVRYAAAHGAKVANISLGEDDFPFAADDHHDLCRAVADVADTMLVVVAAGNDGGGLNAPSLPADCTGAMSVSAVDANLTPTFWSSFDATVAVAAPGNNILSTVPRRYEPQQLAAMSGTSMAAPYVSAVAALLFSEHPDWTAAQVRDRNAVTTLDVAPLGQDPRTGRGVVDPAAAVGATAPPPVAVPDLTAFAAVYDGILDGSPFTYVTWTPDPTAVPTGYRITRWTTGATTTRDVAANVVRSYFEPDPAFYQVTEETADGPISSAPFFAGPADSPAPAERMRAAYRADGSVLLTWGNPGVNADLVDGYVVFVDGETVVSASPGEGRIPTSVVIPKRSVPASDFSVTVGFTTSRGGWADSSLDVRSRTPFVASIARAGTGRYRAYLQLSPMWARSACRNTTCVGNTVRLTVVGHTFSQRIDSRGTVAELFRYIGRSRTLTYVVKVPSHRGLNSTYSVRR